ncbi:hypothetical protein PHJA_001042000 [Phtheirospermum japonicum]|uniref:RanBP2-type domain-containing protein n=1 Tax=Phtheirospermum japonicum TaxID=374723 RepID=A0A830BYT8_9LAMI|nr:hypothetical protein PHJA_001042000 [Phtheirospermum japonicum]
MPAEIAATNVVHPKITTAMVPAGIMASNSGYACDAIPGWKNGDWICNRYGCDMHNYANRMECLKCQTPRDFL